MHKNSIYVQFPLSTSPGHLLKILSSIISAESHKTKRLSLTASNNSIIPCNPHAFLSAPSPSLLHPIHTHTFINAGRRYSGLIKSPSENRKIIDLRLPHQKQ